MAGQEGTASSCEKRTRKYIPGLVEEVFIKGSRHYAATPRLVSLSVTGDDSVVHAEWEATGSSIYKVTAKGKIVQKDDHFEGLKVNCSCPDGASQACLNAMAKNKRIMVCKHAFAALVSVVDPDAQNAYTRKAKERAEARKERAEARKKQEATEKLKQDKELPGERERITNGLDQLKPEKVVILLKEKLKTTEGLRLMSALFDASTMPPPKKAHCLRCNKDFDSQYPSVCRMEHPHAAVNTEWHGSKMSFDCCSRCGGTFNLNGCHSWDRNAPEDDGEYCFEGEHTTDAAEVEDEDWDKDYYE